MVKGEYIYMIQTGSHIKVGMTTNLNSRIGHYITSYDGDASIYVVQVRMARSVERRLLNWCTHKEYLKPYKGKGYSKEHLRTDLSMDEIDMIKDYMKGAGIDDPISGI